MKEEKKNWKYFIINDTRALSSGDFPSDTTGGCLKVKNVNDKGSVHIISYLLNCCLHSWLLNILWLYHLENHWKKEL